MCAVFSVNNHLLVTKTGNQTVQSAAVKLYCKQVIVYFQIQSSGVFRITVFNVESVQRNLVVQPEDIVLLQRFLVMLRNVGGREFTCRESSREVLPQISLEKRIFNTLTT